MDASRIVDSMRLRGGRFHACRRPPLPRVRTRSFSFVIMNSAMNNAHVVRHGFAAAALLIALLRTGTAAPPPAALGTIKASVQSFSLKLLGDRGPINVEG